MTLILGIDPGSRVTGYGLIREHNRQLHYVDSGCIRTSEGAFSDRLLQIFNGICYLMEQFNPNEVAIEQVFIYKNPSSALKLGHARGVAMVACASHRIQISEYSARQVKQSLVGYGAAEKDQVKQMVVNILMLSDAPQSDAADALAIAVCHSHMRGGLTQLRRKR
ncbi:MAG: crossover junction endodeoxyribonuclease RuvC [Legionellaceae bacterium]|nr:crossover junction endodeoxyribonuclease RuvC [Legionellaceae bacterium]